MGVCAVWNGVLCGNGILKGITTIRTIESLIRYFIVVAFGAFYEHMLYTYFLIKQKYFFKVLYRFIAILWMRFFK